MIRLVKQLWFRVHSIKSFHLILWTSFFFVVFALQQVQNWPLVKRSGWGGGSAFVDSRSVLHAADCSKVIGWDIYNPEKWGDCGYIYGSFLIRVLRWLRLGEEATSAMGWGFIVFFSIISGFVFLRLQNLANTQLFFCILIIVSPGSMLLLERGNFDALLMFFLFLSAYSLSSGRFGIGIVILAVGALFKFYLLPLLFLATLIHRRDKSFIMWSLIPMIATVLIAKDLTLIRGDFPRNALGSFGNQIPGLYLNYAGIEFSRLYADVIGLISLLVTIAIVWLLFGKTLLRVSKLFEVERLIGLNTNIQLLFATTFLVCFFAGVNYDYRMPYLTVPVLLVLGNLHSARVNPWFLIVPLFIATWGSFNVGVLQILGDAAFLFLTAILFVLCFLYARNATKLFQKFWW
jgi:hypothetical protein